MVVRIAKILYNEIINDVKASDKESEEGLFYRKIYVLQNRTVIEKNILNETDEGSINITLCTSTWMKFYHCVGHELHEHHCDSWSSNKSFLLLKAISTNCDGQY